MNRNITPTYLKVVSVDDSPIIAQRLNSILAEIENLIFLGNASGFSSAQDLIDAVQPDVVILDITLSNDSQSRTGIHLLSEIREKYPKMKIIIFTNHNELHYRLICHEKGSNYFFDKSKESHKISEVLKQWAIKK